MRLILLFCLAAGPAAAAPFVPPDVTPPDHVVTMELTFFDRKGSSSQVVIRHGEWTRRDSTYTTPPQTTYYRQGSNAYVIDNGWITHFRRKDHLEYDDQARNTGERRTHLGESCTVWETARSKSDSPSGQSFTSLSCFTDDGIELWRRGFGVKGISWSAEAIRIERRAVAAQEARLPRALLELNWWDRKDPATATAAEHETVMELSEGRILPDGSNPAPPTIRTTRRSGPWLFKEVIAGTRRRIEISHDSIRMRLTYERGRRDVEEELTIARPDPDPAQPEPKAFQPVPSDRYDTVLGERCRWSDMTPGMNDGGTDACFTDDGIMLKEEHFSRGARHSTWTATRMVRRPVAIDEVKPPAELLQPRTWDLD
ncbi:hypothetical protein [Bradyrhizobium roseum]|uniref:hypothetical protein n=1 Tax=Bradyrhizobium roseum TaxID=3056648 RepID=UPI00260360B0|nr:hypothetical protein [Bradyrhizobium roseus]WKA31246.1 hypothetical protein QUH67_14225 [Bradyrhizobium roseus]